MPLTSGGEQVYRRAGVARFRVEGQPTSLTLYSSDHPGLFLPFRDATCGRETCGGRRYVDLDGPGADGRVKNDFNYS